jgi:nicotinate-nucleotide pyrophosphorylase (carboxylating)
MTRRTSTTAIPAPPAHVIARVVAGALAEDLADAGDLTSRYALDPDAKAKGVIRARAPGRLAGGFLAEAVFSRLDPQAQVRVIAAEGGDLAPLDAVVEITGPAAALFAGERVALNLLSHLSGIATLTRAYVAAIDGLMARIAHTRKTTPGLRALETYAVLCGGGASHRFGLHDAVLIKDNHIAVAGGVGAALMAVRARAGHMVHVAVEADTLEQLEEALRYSPDVVLLDNFAIPDLEKAVRLVGSRCVTEASGGVTLETVRAIAQTGVDVISVGALTHSAPALDLGLDVEPRR